MSELAACARARGRHVCAGAMYERAGAMYVHAGRHVHVGGAGSVQLLATGIAH